MLLGQGGDMHLTNQNNLTPLDVAIQNNNTEVALSLVERGALVGSDLNRLLLQIIEKNNHIIFSSVINNKTQDDESIDFKGLLDAAISQGNAKILEHILPRCQFPQLCDKYIPRELVMKRTSESKDCVDLLLEWNFTISSADHQDKEYLCKVVEDGNSAIILHLLTLGIDVNFMDLDTKLDLLENAFFGRNYEVVKHLLKCNVNPNMTAFIYTYLNTAVTNSDPILRNLLLKCGTEIKDDPKYFYILCNSVQNNCEAIVRIFLECGGNINHVDSEGKTLLHFCIFCDTPDARYDIAKLLLEEGAITQIQASGNSLTYEAVKHSHRKLAQLFLDHDADIQYICPGGDTLLHIAIKKKFDTEFITALLERNLEIDAVNNEMYTPLLVACDIPSKNQLEIIKALLQYGANVNYTIFKLNTHLLLNINKRTRITNNSFFSNGQTPLHFVCVHKTNSTINIIELLLQHNANIEAQDTRGRTPLFLACELNNVIAVKCLLDHHADVNRTDFQGYTPLYITAKYSRYNYEVFETLVKYKANLRNINTHEQSIIHLIAESNNLELFGLVYNTEMNLNALDKMGNSPLHLAVKKKSVEITERLICCGADVNILDQENDTPLHSVMKEMIVLQQNRANRDIKESLKWSNKMNKYQNIIAILKKQIVKLKIARAHVNSQNVSLVYGTDDYNIRRGFVPGEMDTKSNIQKFEEKCEAEIENMKTVKIGINSMTFNDLLLKNINILSRFIYNKRLQEMINAKAYDKMFPLYINIIRCRCQDAKLLHMSMYYVKKYFRLNIFQRMLEDCIDDIFSYLNVNDITTFLEALIPADE